MTEYMLEDEIIACRVLMAEDLNNQMVRKWIFWKQPRYAVDPVDPTRISNSELVEWLNGKNQPKKEKRFGRFEQRRMAGRYDQDAYGNIFYTYR